MSAERRAPVDWLSFERPEIGLSIARHCLLLGGGRLLRGTSSSETRPKERHDHDRDECVRRRDTCVARRGETRKTRPKSCDFAGRRTARDAQSRSARARDNSTPEVAFTEVPSTERRAVRTRAHDYHRGKPRADRRFTTDFTLYRRDTIKKRNPRFCAEERRRTSRLASENVVWRAGACPLGGAPGAILLASFTDEII